MNRLKIIPDETCVEGKHLECYIDRCLDSARAAARSELLVLSQPEAMEAARADIGVADADPRPIFALKRSIIALELMLAVLLSSHHDVRTLPDPTQGDANGSSS